MDIAVIGASGYTGGELLRLLHFHKNAEVVCATSRKNDTEPVWKVHPHMKEISDLKFTNPDPDRIEADFVFIAVPHTVAMSVAGSLVERGIKTVDLSADYRLPKGIYESVYGVEHTCFMEVPYGIPELHRDEINAKTNFVANPGCFPTGATLAAAPLANYAETVVYDSKTGATGAGANPSGTTHYPNVGDNFSAYKITTHRHTAEMRQELSKLGSEAKCYFTPHLLPVNRGILTTAHILLSEPLSQDEVIGIYRDYYSDEFFVRMQRPTIAGVRGSNFCDIQVESEGIRVVAVSAIDNLVKGASGQAIQNMNLMCGFAEVEGLANPAMFP